MDKQGEEAKFLAGGHSLIPAMKLRLLSRPFWWTSVTSTTCAAFASTATRWSSAP